MTAPIAPCDELPLLFAKREPSQTVLVPRSEKADQWVGSGSPYLLDGFNLPNEVTFNLEDSNEMNDGTVKLATPVEANSQADSQGCSHSATSLKGKKRKASSVDAVERELKGIKDAIKDVARAIREGNLIAERGRPRVYSSKKFSRNW
ncbi:hypothetical protein NC652_015067 [Populus alba x Populus x berolinensis]|nr:hypothetical protein NC652_015067 [Populus alba x Populus x berolinensis]